MELNVINHKVCLQEECWRGPDRGADADVGSRAGEEGEVRREKGMDRQALSCSSAGFWCLLGCVPIHIFQVQDSSASSLGCRRLKKTQGFQHCVS